MDVLIGIVKCVFIALALSVFIDWVYRVHLLKQIRRELKTAKDDLGMMNNALVEVGDRFHKEVSERKKDIEKLQSENKDLKESLASARKVAGQSISDLGEYRKLISEIKSKIDNTSL